jgi:hypothetical protein
MKKHLRIFGIGLVSVLGLVILTPGCTKDENGLTDLLEDNSKFQIVTPNQDDYTKIDFLVNSYGYSREDILVTESSILAEGDIAFERLNFWELYKSAKDTVNQLKRHYKWINLAWAVKEIPVYISSSVNSAWKSSILSSYNEYNILNGRIYFTLSKSYTLTGINISTGTLSSNTYIAEAGYPGLFGLPGNITINTYYANKLTVAEKKRVMTHEIGHTIGIRHTDKGEGTLISGISDVSRADPTSVMVSILNSSYSGFSTADKQAFLFLYPRP